VVVAATGGTIAGAGGVGYGYSSGELSVNDLIHAVPDLEGLAELSGEQVANIGSQDMNDEVWLRLARRLKQISADEAVDAVVVTHGTDTMEETAYFLSLVVPTEKPIVLVGSMRPATAIGADGPANLYNAVATAVDPTARGRGPMVVLNDKIHYARNVTKTKTTAVDTFASPNRGPAGLVHAGSITWFAPLDRRHSVESELSIDGVDRLPLVEIVYAHASMGTVMIDAALERGAEGIVVAGLGNGNMPQAALEALEDAVRRGVVVVRSTRLESGLVLRNNEVDDDAAGFVASGELNPAKSRALLVLALLKTRDPREVQRIFDQY
jgi:L-asparaginase